MRTLTIVRKKGAYGILRKLILVVDGEPVGHIRHGKRLELDVPEDAVELSGKMDWAYTASVALQTVRPYQVITFQPKPFRQSGGDLGLSGLPFNVTIE